MSKAEWVENYEQAIVDIAVHDCVSNEIAEKTLLKILEEDSHYLDDYSIWK